MDEGNPKKVDSLERESSLISSSSSSTKFFGIVLEGGKGKEEKLEKTHSLSLKSIFEQVYGISYHDRTTIKELNMMSKYSSLLDEMDSQRAFTISYISFLFEGEISENTIRKICTILVKRGILNVYRWEGKAASTWGVHVYHAPNASELDIESCLIEYKSQDELRYIKEQQRKTLKEKKKKTAEELKQIWMEQSQAADEARSQRESEKEEQEIRKLGCRRAYFQGISCKVFSKDDESSWCNLCKEDSK